MRIQTKNLEELLVGSSLLACGGGLSLREQQKLACTPSLKRALKKGISILPVSTLSDDACVISVSEVGAANAPVMDKTLLPEALNLLKEKTGKQFTALIPSEIGQETITLDSATVLGLPIVDADLSGCRAVPRLSDCTLARKGTGFTMSPLVVLFTNGQMKFVEKQLSLEEDEKIVRSLVPPGEIVTIIGGLLDGAIVKEFLDFPSYSLAINLGRKLRLSKNFTSVFSEKVLVEPLPIEVTRVTEINKKGFNSKKVTATSERGNIQIDIQNEYMKCIIGEQNFSFPQMIMMLDDFGRTGLHSSEIVSGVKAKLVIVDTFQMWK